MGGIQGYDDNEDDAKYEQPKLEDDPNDKKFNSYKKMDGK